MSIALVWYGIGEVGPESLGLAEAPGGDENKGDGVLNGARILLVEDNTVNQQVAKEILQSAGATVEIAANGEQAYRLICVDAHAYDAVLMDLQMPVMDGYAATRLIRESFGPDELSILAMTANAMGEERQKCLDAGMNDYITKPIDVNALYAMLVKWLPPRKTSPAPVHKLSTPVLEIAVENMVLPESLDGFDLVDGLERMLGRPELYLQFLMKMVEDNADDVQRVRDALARGDYDTAHRLAHTLKGVSGNLSAQDLYAAASDLSEAIKDKDDRLEDRLNVFERELDRAVAAVRALREQ